jgi:hypothetical protein
MTEITGSAGRQEGLASQASAKAQDAASVAQEKASEVREQGSARMREQFDQRSTQAGAQARSLAEALRRSGSDLSSEGNSGAAQVTGQAADRIERVGVYLEEKSRDELMRDIEMFARRRPWTLAGLGMLAGMAAARFVKASSERRYDDYRASGRWSTRPGVQTSPATEAYGDAELPSSSGGLVSEPEAVGPDAQDTLSDDPLAREPYAGRR